MAGKDPIIPRRRTLPFPVEQNGSEFGIQRKVILRILRLDLVHHAVHNGTGDRVQPKLMRHAQIATTMNVYGNAMMESKRAANSKVVQMVLRQYNARKAK